MNVKPYRWSGLVVGLALLGSMGVRPWVDIAQAAETGTPVERSVGGRGANGFLSLLQHKVGLTPEQLDGVKGLLSEQRQQLSSVREQTDIKIRGLLTAQQQPKFDAVIAEMKARRGKAKAA